MYNVRQTRELENITPILLLDLHHGPANDLSMLIVGSVPFSEFRVGYFDELCCLGTIWKLFDDLTDGIASELGEDENPNDIRKC